MSKKLEKLHERSSMSLTLAVATCSSLATGRDVERLPPRLLDLLPRPRIAEAPLFRDARGARRVAVAFACPFVCWGWLIGKADAGTFSRWFRY